MELLHSPWSIQLRMANSNIACGRNLECAKKYPEFAVKTLLEVKLFPDTSSRKEMFTRKQEVGCLAHNNRNVIHSIIDCIHCTSTCVRDVALFQRYRFKDIGGRRRTGDTGRAPARKKGSAVRSTTTSCETAYEPVKA